MENSGHLTGKLPGAIKKIVAITLLLSMSTSAFAGSANLSEIWPDTVASAKLPAGFGKPTVVRATDGSISAIHISTKNDPRSVYKTLVAKLGQAANPTPEDSDGIDAYWKLPDGQAVRYLAVYGSGLSRITLNTQVSAPLQTSSSQAASAPLDISGISQNGVYGISVGTAVDSNLLCTNGFLAPSQQFCISSLATGTFVPTQLHATLPEGFGNAEVMLVSGSLCLQAVRFLIASSGKSVLMSALIKKFGPEVIELKIPNRSRFSWHLPGGQILALDDATNGETFLYFATAWEAIDRSYHPTAPEPQIASAAQLQDQDQAAEEQGSTNSLVGLGILGILAVIASHGRVGGPAVAVHKGLDLNAPIRHINGLPYN